MLDCCEQKLNKSFTKNDNAVVDDVRQKIIITSSSSDSDRNDSVVVQPQQKQSESLKEKEDNHRPINERKVSFHRRFVESQKELKILQEKLRHVETINVSLQNDIHNNNCVSKEEHQQAMNKIEQLQQEINISKQELQNESIQHQNTKSKLTKVQEQLVTVQEELDHIHDSRLDVITLKRQLDAVVSSSLESNHTLPAVVRSKDIERQYETTKKELQTAQNTITSLNAKLDQIQVSKTENEERTKTIIDNYHNQIQRQEIELEDLRIDRVKLQHQIQQQQSMLWDVEESRHNHKLRYIKLLETNHNNMMNQSFLETEKDEIIHNMTIEQCKSVVTIESIRRKNRHLEALKISLQNELIKKNAVICQMSRCRSLINVSKLMNEEQERTLNMATDVSIAYAENQMKVDKLSETINRLKSSSEQQHIQKIDNQQHCMMMSPSSFRSRLLQSSSSQSRRPPLDGIQSMSSLFSKSFNVSFSNGGGGLDSLFDFSNTNHNNNINTD